MSNDVKVKISVVDQVTNEIKKISKNLENFSIDAKKSIGDLGKNLVSGFAGYFALNSIKQFANESIQSYERHIEVTTKLSAVLIATNNKIRLSRIELENIASKIQSVTTASKDQILTIESMLITYNNMSGKTLPRVVEMAVNLTNVFGSVEGAAKKLGEVLQSPAKKLESLEEFGIKFSNTQIEQIKNFVATNDVASAQNIILTELEKRYAGVARELANTPVGRVKQLKNEIEDLKSSIGEGLYPGVKLFYQWVDLSIKSLVYNTDLGVKLLTEKSIDIAKAKNDIRQIESGSLKWTEDEKINYYTEKINNLNEELRKTKKIIEENKLPISPATNFKIKKLEDELEMYRSVLKPHLGSNPDTNTNTNANILTDEQKAAQERIDKEIAKAKINNITDRFKKEIAQTKANYKELEELAKANGISTTELEKQKAIAIQRIRDEEAKFNEEKNKKQIEDARKTAEEQLKIAKELQDKIKQQNENRSLIEDLTLTDNQLTTKNKKKSVSNKYQAGIDAALALGDTGMAERLSKTKGQAIVQVDNDEYKSKLNKFDDTYFESIQNKTIEGFAKEREALEAHFSEMELMYENNVERIAEINKEKYDATKNLDNTEKKVLKENMLGHVRTTLDSLQKLTENNKKFSALNKTIAIASVTYDTIKTAQQVYKDVSAFVGKLNPIAGIAAGAAAAGIVGAAGMARVAQIANTKSYASGLRSSQGEYAKVHKDELIYLPRGAEVINKRETNNIVNNDKGVTFVMNFQDRTSETFKVLSSDIRNGKMDNFVRELTRRAQKV